MANFYLQYSASVTPIEELIGADGSDKTRIIHSNIDKSVGGGKEVTSGTAATDVVYKDYTTTDAYERRNNSWESVFYRFYGCKDKRIS